jgi:hypothetical protein
MSQENITNLRVDFTHLGFHGGFFGGQSIFNYLFCMLILFFSGAGLLIAEYSELI